MIKNLSLSIILFIATCISINAQTGKITGRLIEEGNNESMPFANIIITQNGVQKGGSTTDIDGNYTIIAESGTYTLVAAYVSFATTTINNIEVKANETTKIDVSLKSQAIQVEEFTIVAVQSKQTEGALQLVKRKSVNLVDGVSAHTFKKTGDNNAASALKRVTGVSVENGKDVYVRGLGDRYTKTTLNGITIPGLDPDKNSVQVDIFPTNIIDNIVIYKSFSPDLPGDFTGGMVDIATKEFPEQFIMGVSASYGYNPNMNLKSNFLTYKGSENDNYALGASDKDLPINPSVLTPSPSFVDSPEGKLINQNVESVVNSFSKEMAAIEGNSFINQNYSFSIGNLHEKGKNTFGYTLAMGYKNSYKFYENVVFNSYRKSADKSITQLELNDNDSGSIGKQEVLWNSLVSFSLKRKKSKYSLTGFHTQNGIKTASKLLQQYSGNSTNPGAQLEKNILYYNQRSITNVLLKTRHNLNDNLDLDVSLSPSLAINREPDLRQVFFSVEEDGNRLLDNGAGALVNRTYRNLEEINLNGKVNLKWSFNQWSKLKSYLKVGGNYVYKNRDFDVVEYNFVEIPNRGKVYTNGADEIFNGSLFDANTNYIDPNNRGGIHAKGQTDSSSIYNADITIVAGYLMNELPIDSSLKVIYGARLEQTHMTYTGQKQSASLPEDYFNERLVINELDILPSVSVIYGITENINLRANYSNTLARPSFKEKSLAEIYDPVTQQTFIGNIDLETTKISNYDLRLERFFGSNGIISISGFYKDFTNPIELVAYSADSPDNITPRNVEKATVTGVELEAKKSLAFIYSKLESVSVGGNFTYAKSNVNMGESEYLGRLQEARNGETVEKTRAFQGQAPYVVNTFVNFSHYDKGVDINLSYNVQGESLAVVGIARNSDVYNSSFHNMSFKASKKLGKNKQHKISFGIRNILDAKREKYYSSYQAEKLLFSSFNEGRSFGFSYSFAIK